MIYIIFLVSAYMFMEFAAWFSHKYIMHGSLWVFHRDHHIKTSNTGSFFEKNDLFFLIYAIPAIILIMTGFIGNMISLLYIGAGITLYGFTYFAIHDVLIHQHIPLRIIIRKGYFAALIRAHKAHHEGKNVKDFRNYGLLVFPRRFFNN